MKRPFHGWKMVAAGGGIQFLQASLLLQSFGAYVAVLRDDRHGRLQPPRHPSPITHAPPLRERKLCSCTPTRRGFRLA